MIFSRCDTEVLQGRRTTFECDPKGEPRSWFRWSEGINGDLTIRGVLIRQGGFVGGRPVAHQNPGLVSLVDQQPDADLDGIVDLDVPTGNQFGEARHFEPTSHQGALGLSIRERDPGFVPYESITYDAMGNKQGDIEGCGRFQYHRGILFGAVHRQDLLLLGIVIGWIV